jgi:putative GTP pyrophosphokinase
LIRRLLAVSGYRVHSVTSRLKDRSKVGEKLRREGKEYQRLSNMTDIAGVRVITHFDDEVDKIGTLQQSYFMLFLYVHICTLRRFCRNNSSHF